MKFKWLALMVAGVCAASLTNASAISTTTTFGSLPSATFGGSGIPNGQVEITTISGISDPYVQSGSDTITIGESAHARFATPGNLANNGNGTYFADPGLQSGKALWNFDFDVSSSAGFIARYTFTLTYGLEGGASTTINLLSSFGDSTGGPGSAQNSMNLGFLSQGGPIGFDPNQLGIYDFTINAYEGDTHLGSDTVHINVGSVPDGGNTLGLLGTSLACIGFGVYIKRKPARSAAVAA